MAIDLDETVKRGSFENRLASTEIDGQRVTAQARVGDKKFGGDPYIVYGPAGADQYERFDSIDAIVEAFEELIEKYDMAE
jgi:hypothetical protein